MDQYTCADGAPPVPVCTENCALHCGQGAELSPAAAAVLLEQLREADDPLAVICSSCAVIGDHAASCCERRGSEPPAAEEWVASYDEEWFDSVRYASREEAIEGFPTEDTDLDEGYEGFYVGRTVIVKTPCVPGWLVAEHASESLCEDIDPDVVAGWPACTTTQEQELGERLTRTFHRWLEDHGLMPSFYTVEDVEYVKREASHG